MNDLKFAFRQLLKNPGFTTVAVLTLALGIGANTAIFSVINGVMLRPLPYHDPNSLVWLYHNKPQREWLQFPMPTHKFEFWRDQSQSFEQMGLMCPVDFHLAGARSPELLRGLKVTANLCDLLGIQPMLGRSFRSEENQPGAARVALLSYGLWQRRFAGDPKIVGLTIRDHEQVYTVVGVLPPNLKFPIGPTPAWRVLSSGEPEIWLPLIFRRPGEENGEVGFPLARLQPGISPKQAQVEMTDVVQRHEQIYPKVEGWSVDVIPIREQVSGQIGPALRLLFAAVASVLLIGCLNVANLLLGRSITRQREFAIRAAVGAGTRQLVRQLLTESLLLSSLGGVAGILLAYWALPALLTLSPGALPRGEEIRIDLGVLGFTTAISLVAGLLFGLVPAWQVLRGDLAKTIQTAGSGSIGNFRRQRLRQTLVLTEVALSLVLLTSTGLLLRSLMQVMNVKTGYQPEKLLVMNLSFAAPKYADRVYEGSGDTAKNVFVKDVLARLESLPGVAAAGFSFGIPLAKGIPINKPFKVQGRSVSPGEDPYFNVRIRIVSSNYFSAMGIPLLKGNRFSDVHSPNAESVQVIINQSAARKVFPNADPIGQLCNFGRIVGVVADTLEAGLDQKPEPQFYIQGYSATEAFLIVRTLTTPDTVRTAVMNEIAAVDRDLPVHNVTTMETMVAGSLAQRRFQVGLLAVFGTSALLLTMIGIYGVVAFSVTQRTQEIGLRIALGAQRNDVLKLILAEGLKPVLIGVILGLACAWAVTRILSSQLFGVTPTDPLTFMSVCLLLLGSAAMACLFPARGATQLDPIKALKSE